MTEHRNAGTLVHQIEEEHIARLAYAIYESYAARHHPRSPEAVRRYGPSSSFADRVRETLKDS
jgi:hypothetical protein